MPILDRDVADQAFPWTFGKDTSNRQIVICTRNFMVLQVQCNVGAHDPDALPWTIQQVMIELVVAGLGEYRAALSHGFGSPSDLGLLF